ncbi:MAG: WD40 repeat domain-containing protein, partial [Endozoicomonas sp.]
LKECAFIAVAAFLLLVWLGCSQAQTVDVLPEHCEDYLSGLYDYQSAFIFTGHKVFCTRTQKKIKPPPYDEGMKSWLIPFSLKVRTPGFQMAENGIGFPGGYHTASIVSGNRTRGETEEEPFNFNDAALPERLLPDELPDWEYRELLEQWRLIQEKLPILVESGKNSRVRIYLSFVDQKIRVAVTPPANMPVQFFSSLDQLILDILLRIYKRALAGIAIPEWQDDKASECSIACGGSGGDDSDPDKNIRELAPFISYEFPIWLAADSPLLNRRLLSSSAQTKLALLKTLRQRLKWATQQGNSSLAEILRNRIMVVEIDRAELLGDMASDHLSESHANNNILSLLEESLEDAYEVEQFLGQQNTSAEWPASLGSIHVQTRGGGSGASSESSNQSPPAGEASGEHGQKSEASFSGRRSGNSSRKSGRGDDDPTPPEAKVRKTVRPENRCRNCGQRMALYSSRLAMKEHSDLSSAREICRNCLERLNLSYLPVAVLDLLFAKFSIDEQIILSQTCQSLRTYYNRHLSNDLAITALLEIKERHLTGLSQAQIDEQIRWLGGEDALYEKLKSLSFPQSLVRAAKDKNGEALALMHYMRDRWAFGIHPQAKLSDDTLNIVYLLKELPGDRLASAHGYYVAVWDTHSFALLCKFRTLFVNAMAVLDNDTLAVGVHGFHGVIELWNSHTGRYKYSMEIPRVPLLRIRDLAVLLPIQRLAAAVEDSSNVHLWNTQSRKFEGMLPSYEFTTPINSLIVSSGGSLVIAYSRAIVVLKFASKNHASYLSWECERICSICVAPWIFLVSGPHNNELHFWDIYGNLAQSLPCEREHCNLLALPDHRLMIADYDELEIWNPQVKQRHTERLPQKMGHYGLATITGGRIASGIEGGEIIIWDFYHSQAKQNRKAE